MARVELAREKVAMATTNNLTALRRARGLTQQVIAERLGVSIPQISRWENGHNNIPSGRLPAIAAAYEASVSDVFIRSEGALSLGPTLYVRGEIAAGIWREAFEWGEDDWLAFTGRPDLSVPEQARFGLRVHGESMNLLYPHGTIVECLAIGSAPTLSSGKRVVVVRENEAGEVEATVKEYVERDGETYLWPRSNHPDFQQPWRIGDELPGITRMSIVAIVVASIRME